MSDTWRRNKVRPQGVNLIFSFKNTRNIYIIMIFIFLEVRKAHQRTAS